ncbi:MAG TPA: choice-of-anchor D domain-containing protein [Bryobacteraceae bacterium]
MLQSTVISIGRSVTITGNAQLNSTGSFAFVIWADNVSISGLTFNGAGVYLIEIPQQTGFTFTNNTVQNTNGKDGVVVDGVLRTSNISGNTFSSIAPNGFASATYTSLGFGGCYSRGSCDTPGVAIQIFGGIDQTTIDNNSFDLIANDAMHIGWNIIAADGTYFLTKNNDISYNKFSRVHRIGIEAQAIWSYPYCGVNRAYACDISHDFSTNTTIKGNYFHDPFITYVESYAYSLALWGSGQYVNNAGLANVTTGQTPGFAMEDMGNNVLTQGNVLAADYIPGAQPHGWGGYIVYGSQRAGTTFTAQDNVLCGDQAATINFGVEPNSSGTKVSTNNYVSNTCPNAGSLTRSAFTLAFVSPATSAINGTWKLAAMSALPIKYVRFFLDGAANPIATQEIQDVSTTFATDRKWLYHAAVNASTLGAGNHTIVAKATDVAGATQSVSQSFTSGSASTPKVQITPSSFSFGSQTLGVVTAKMTVTLSNTGNGLLTISGISRSGTNAADFLATSGCGSSLAAGASCAINTVFTPWVTGSESATISITDNASGSPHTIAMSGTGVAPVGSTPPPVTPPPVIPPPTTTLPTNLPKGMLLWLANDAGVITTGTAVSLWQDQSGSGNDAIQSSAANQPTIVTGNNGQHALRFDGQANFMSIPSLPISGLTGMTVFLVTANTQNESSVAGYGRYAFLSWLETLSWGKTFFGTYQTSSHFRFGTTESGNENTYQLPLNLGNSFALSEWMHGGTTDSMWLNAQSVASYSGKLQTINGTASSATLGRGDQNSYYSGEASEVIIYKRGLTTAERQIVEQYLMNKYHL